MESLTLKPQFVEFIPSDPKEGVLYISEKYRTSTHLCACGCQMKVILPLKPTFWSIEIDGGLVSIEPSVGNWSFPCKSHYWITRNAIEWAPSWSNDRIYSSHGREQDRRKEYYEELNKKSSGSFITKLWKWLKDVFANRR